MLANACNIYRPWKYKKKKEVNLFFTNAKNLCSKCFSSQSVDWVMILRSTGLFLSVLFTPSLSLQKIYVQDGTFVCLI